MPNDFSAVVLAAGQGTRMKSALPKVLHPVAGLPLYAHVVDAALSAGAREVVVVVGHGREAVEADMGARFDARVRPAEQVQQRGTGDAVRAALPALGECDGWVVILCGDTPLVPPALIEALVRAAKAGKGPLAMLTTVATDPHGYGRILRSESGHIVGIREHKDASAAELRINEVNPGIYAVRADFLKGALAQLTNDNVQGELYLTDVVAQAAQAGEVQAVACKEDEVQGINDRAQLAACAASMRLRIAIDLARSGVTVHDPHTLYVDRSVRVAPDVTLAANVHLRGQTTIARGAHIDTGCVLTNVTVAEDAQLKPYTVAADSHIGPSAQAGPFSHLRPESVMEQGARIGNFVEMKKTRLGPGSKANHLAYLGDATLGRDVNVGAGTIFCNYDGFGKHQTVIEDEVFVGSDSQLVAPVHLGKGAYVATGTTVTRDVPEDALALSRVRQDNKLGYASRLKARLRAAREKKKG